MPPKKKLEVSDSYYLHYSPSPAQSRGTSPVPFKQYDNIISNLNPGEYISVHQAKTPPVNHRRLRNALILGGLGLAGGAIYKFNQPLLRLGHQGYNYVKDKFHNLFQSNNTTHTPNPHNY